MKNSKVLVIDDDPGTCSLLELVLEIENYQPASRKAIEQGDIVSLLNQEKPDILILDLHLGSEDALKYIRSIRSHPDWQDLRILATSAMDHWRECMEAGTDDFILKPFNWEDVIKKIKRLDHKTV
jgi:DNA-binding response OmpR family regulator